MILANGPWQGRGTLLWGDDPRGTPISCQLTLRPEGETLVLEGELVGPEANQRREISLWLHPDDNGTWEIHLRLGGSSCTGMAKLASHPRLALLWQELPADASADQQAAASHASCTLFPVDDGHGLRGILRQGGFVGAWELVLRQPQPDSEPSGNGKVLSFRRR